MISDLLWHEVEVVKAFYARTMSWIAPESASESAKLVGARSETVASAVIHHSSPQQLEMFLDRSVINELNAICEFALQETWRKVTSEENLPNGELIFTAARGSIEKALKDKGVDVQAWPRWSDVLKIKELSEAYKHRQRMQPFPVELQRPGYEWRARRNVAPESIEAFTPYDLERTRTSESVSAVEELLHWLRSTYAV